MTEFDAARSILGGMTIPLPSLIRIEPAVIDRLGLYLTRNRHQRIALLASDGLPAPLLELATSSISTHGVQCVAQESVVDASFETAIAIFRQLPSTIDAVVGVGGGRAIDLAKYVSALAYRPFYAVPTSLSNDGFASPQASLTMAGRRRSFPTQPPSAIIIDVDLCLDAPRILWLSGVGEMVAKLTALNDWRTANNATGETINDLACLLSDATVHQVLANPTYDRDGLRQLAVALLLNGVSMSICGSSRPASGSEHLVSHALDEISARPRLHGIQVGLAAYICSRLQGDKQTTATISSLFQRTGFWSAIRQEPLSRNEWLEAFRRAPSIKPDRYTVLSSRDCCEQVAAVIDSDSMLSQCFASDR